MEKRRMLDQMTPILDLLNNRFDEQEKLFKVMFDAHSFRIASVETIVSTRNADHDKIEQKVVDKLEPKIDHIVRSLDKHIIDDRHRIDLIENRVHKLEDAGSVKIISNMDKIKDAAIRWGVPVILFALFAWIGAGFPFTNIK